MDPTEYMLQNQNPQHHHQHPHPHSHPHPHPPHVEAAWIPHSYVPIAFPTQVPPSPVFWPPQPPQPPRPPMVALHPPPPPPPQPFTYNYQQQPQPQQRLVYHQGPYQGPYLGSYLGSHVSQNGQNSGPPLLPQPLTASGPWNHHQQQQQQPQQYQPQYQHVPHRAFQSLGTPPIGAIPASSVSILPNPPAAPAGQVDDVHLGLISPEAGGGGLSFGLQPPSGGAGAGAGAGADNHQLASASPGATSERGQQSGPRSPFASPPPPPPQQQQQQQLAGSQFSAHTAYLNSTPSRRAAVAPRSSASSSTPSPLPPQSSSASSAAAPPSQRAPRHAVHLPPFAPTSRETSALPHLTTSDRRRSGHQRARRSASSRLAMQEHNRGDSSERDDIGYRNRRDSQSSHDSVDDIGLRQLQVLRGSVSSKLVVSKSALRSLQSVEIESLPEEERTCVICYNEFGVETPEGINEAPLKLPKCKHIFGDHCIKKWFEDSDSCPYCRDRLPSEPKHNINSARALINMLRMHGNSAPYGMPAELYLRIVNGVASDDEVADVASGNSNEAERRSPPDDAAENQRRIRPRHNDPRGAGAGSAASSASSSSSSVTADEPEVPGISSTRIPREMIQQYPVWAAQRRAAILASSGFAGSLQPRFAARNGRMTRAAVMSAANLDQNHQIQPQPATGMDETESQMSVPTTTPGVAPISEMRNRPW